MKKRDFLKLTSLSGLGLLHFDDTNAQPELIASQSGRQQKFNMCGYAAPKIDTVRIGYIGLGTGAAAQFNEFRSWKMWK